MSTQGAHTQFLHPLGSTRPHEPPRNERSPSREASASPPPPTPPPNYRPAALGVSPKQMEPRLNPSPPPASEMELGSSLDESASASAWDWDGLLDLSFDEDDDDPLLLSQISPPFPQPVPSPTSLPPSPHPSAPAPASGSRVRKRDPRLVCENYLAGRVPCACPEMDAEEAEASEVAAGAMKRARAGGAVGGAQCQVPGCEADIRELKGYHRRHRVCLRCASAHSVLLDGEHKRYCQQCGKFHILPDFDKGKRSCRRKLEWHNERRRRRPTDLRSIVEEEKEPKEDLLAHISCDAEPQEEMLTGLACETFETVMSKKIMDREAILESEHGHRAPFPSLPSSQYVKNSNIASFTSSGDAHIDERVDNPQCTLSSIICDNRSAYSSVCPTGRISFKLYDWNPAEFPRQLRHQIFQWLASMPIELEGYVRPGCTILTIFIAMPQFMWEKLSREVALYVRDLVNAPESLFLGRGSFLIDLSNMIVQVMRDGTSLMNIKMVAQVPKLHYVYPTYFEAGKSMEFVACGCNLDQPKFRFLVSFAGKYLVYDSCCAISHREVTSHNGYGRASVHSSEHEVFRISITQTEADMFGPAFIEVENESGLSNFIPVFFGSKHVCSELEMMEEALGRSICENDVVSQIAVSDASPSFCEFFVSKQTAMSDLFLDIAWLLKEPHSEDNGTILSTYNVLRLTSLLDFLVQNGFMTILKEILHSLDKQIDWQAYSGPVNKISEADWRQFQRKINHAKEIICRRAEHDVRSEHDSNVLCVEPLTNRDGETRIKDDFAPNSSPTSQGIDEHFSLLTGDIIHRRHCFTGFGMKWPQASWDNLFHSTVIRTRLGMFVLVGIVMCFGACVMLLHPQTMRRLFGGTMR